MIDSEKLYTRKELQAMNGTDFSELYTHLNAWVAAVTGYRITEYCTTLDFVLIMQSKKAVCRALGRNILREMELMGMRA